MIDTEHAIIEDLAADYPLRWETHGQGSYGYVCRYCEASDYLGPITHKESCVWRRAINLERSGMCLHDTDGDGDCGRRYCPICYDQT